MQQNLSELRDYLEIEFQHRLILNRLYSRRAFARDLGISATSLNEFLGGHRSLSFQNIDRVFKYLRKKSGVTCDWCGKSKKQAGRIVRGSKSQHICEPCIEICNDILRTDRPA